MKKRIWGVLLGGALGDAMGMPTECWSQNKIKEIFPKGVNRLYPSRVEDTFSRDFKAGSITDDTINVLMILKMLINQKGIIDVNSYIEELLKWNESSEISAFVSGPSTLRALEKIKKGAKVEETGVSGTTNGASMKIAPIGIISDYKHLDELIENVYQICLPTHNTKIAIAGASAVAAAVSYVVRGGKSINELWRLAYTTIKASEKYGSDFPSASLIYRMEKARKILHEETNEKMILKRLYDEIGTGMETIETIPSAFSIIELSEGNPIKAAQLSAEIGWDTDTIGAISASICGGMNPTFPLEMISTLEKVNNIDFKRMANEILPYVK